MHQALGSACFQKFQYGLIIAVCHQWSKDQSAALTFLTDPA